MDKGQLQVNLFDEITAEAETMGKKTTISDSLVSGSKAMDMLDLSRHSFEKIVESGAITPQIVSGKKYYVQAALPQRECRCARHSFLFAKKKQKAGAQNNGVTARYPIFE